MNAKDLLRAMSDIDPKYVREAQPWAAPVKKLTHPVWAAAAALVLCLGLGAGAALLLSPPQAQPIPAAAEEQESALAFEQLAMGEEKIVPLAGTYGPAYAQASAAAENEETYRELSLTREQLEALWNGNDLPWDGIGLENVTLDATAAFQEEELIQVYIEAPDFFAIQLVSQAYAEAYAADWAQQVEESFAIANNLVEGTPVVAVSYDVTTLTDGKEVAQTDAQARFALGEAIVTVTASSSETPFPTQEDAEAFVAQVVNQCLTGGIDLSGLQETESLSFPTLGEDAFQEIYELYTIPQNIGAGEWYKGEALTLEDAQALLGGELPWTMDLGEDLRWDVQSTYDPEGELWDVYLGVYRDTGLEEPEGSASSLSIHLIPQEGSSQWPEEAAALGGGTASVEGATISTASAPVTLENSREDSTLVSAQGTGYFAGFCLEQTTVSVFTCATDRNGFTPEQAQDLASQAVQALAGTAPDLSPLQR